MRCVGHVPPASDRFIWPCSHGGDAISRTWEGVVPEFGRLFPSKIYLSSSIHDLEGCSAMDSSPWLHEAIGRDEADGAFVAPNTRVDEVNERV